MSSKYDALKLALKALESAKPKYTRKRKDQTSLGGALDYWMLEQHQRLGAITAIKEALAQPEQESVECMCGICKLGPAQEPVENVVAYHSDGTRTVRISPKRPWVGLTDKEAMQICVDCGCMSEDWLTLLDAIEAKLKDKNS